MKISGDKGSGIEICIKGNEVHVRKTVSNEYQRKLYVNEHTYRCRDEDHKYQIIEDELMNFAILFDFSEGNSIEKFEYLLQFLHKRGYIYAYGHDGYEYVIDFNKTHAMGASCKDVSAFCNSNRFHVRMNVKNGYIYASTIDEEENAINLKSASAFKILFTIKHNELTMYVFRDDCKFYIT